MEDYLEWAHQAGEMRLLFHEEADIQLRIMDRDESKRFEESKEPSFNANLADA